MVVTDLFHANKIKILPSVIGIHGKMVIVITGSLYAVINRNTFVFFRQRISCQVNKSLSLHRAVFPTPSKSLETFFLTSKSQGSFKLIVVL